MSMNQNYVHIRVQQRTGRKTVTTIQGIPSEYDLKKLVRHLKKKYNCNGTVVQDPNYGEVIQLNGDHRQDVFSFLCELKITTAENCRVHGF